MIRGPHFAIGHVGRCAGDAVMQMLLPIAPDHWDIVSQDDHAKHQPFVDADLEKNLILSIRRLPSWMLSMADAVTKGLYPDYKPRPRPTLEQMRNPNVEYGDPAFQAEYGKSFATIADKMLRPFRPELVNVWLRKECLREDVLALAPKLLSRELKVHEWWLLQGTETKYPEHYNHNWREMFDVSNTQVLYQNNPLWQRAEARAYGPHGRIPIENREKE